MMTEEEQIRFECLRLATAHAVMGMTDAQIVQRAEAFAAFVSPKEPEVAPRKLAAVGGTAGALAR